jgi:hypothetical protein
VLLLLPVPVPALFAQQMMEKYFYFLLAVELPYVIHIRHDE